MTDVTTLETLRTAITAAHAARKAADADAEIARAQVEAAEQHLAAHKSERSAWNAVGKARDELNRCTTLATIASRELKEAESALASAELVAARELFETLAAKTSDTAFLASIEPELMTVARIFREFGSALESLDTKITAHNDLVAQAEKVGTALRSEASSGTPGIQGPLVALLNAKWPQRQHADHVRVDLIERVAHDAVGRTLLVFRPHPSGNPVFGTGTPDTARHAELITRVVASGANAPVQRS